MQAYIKNENTLVVNIMTYEGEEEELRNYLAKVEDENNEVIPQILFNIEGNPSGIAFKVETKKEEE